MEKEEFVETLKKLNLTKKSFAKLVGLQYGSINNWGTTINNKILPIPAWVKPFLEHYEKSKKFDYITDKICSEIQLIK